MRHPAPEQRPGILTAWLVLLLACNAVSALWGVVASWVMLLVRQYSVTGRLDGALEETDIPPAEARSFIEMTALWAVTYTALRVLAVAALVGLLFEKRWAFWYFAATSILVFAVQLWGGEALWLASLDLLGLGLLVGIMRWAERRRWPPLPLHRETAP